MAKMVLDWGPLQTWSAFPFEDGNGFVKRVTHGPNKLDIELANTLKILNAHQILKNQLGYGQNEDGNMFFECLGKASNFVKSEDELIMIEKSCSLNNMNLFNIKIYPRVKINWITFTSEMYKRQMERNNFYIFLKESSFCKVLRFLKIDNRVFAVVKLLGKDVLEKKIHMTNPYIDLSSYLIPFRETYCITIIPSEQINGKVMRVRNFLCMTQI